MSGRRSSAIVLVVIAVAISSIVAGHPAVGEVIVGATVLCASASIGWKVTRRASLEVDPARELVLDLQLILVVLLGLAGVTVIGLAIP